MSLPEQHLLVFGASGAIGAEICRMASDASWQVTGVSRTGIEETGRIRSIVADPLAPGFCAEQLASQVPYTGICWAQGMNATDSVYSVQQAKNLELYSANCLYILETLKILLGEKLLAPGSRLCVISSIWQNLARQNKLSYCMTKAAIQGLVLSASVDLAPEGHLINAVLPGAVDTPMTRTNLSAQQIDRMTGGTEFHRLTSLMDVASAVLYLCSPQNTGITGQFICVDLGWSRARIV
ncbi:SDR family oxidoreductase [Terriglobus albidus]|uniref:SDR family oxidoreductase n=1 Tax=Terriglobus albidus TaxID=1592106 RepID=A0A5B9E7C0_9BACT|nr:SDR family oxidoreductase [Terriglobus albidus]QEE27958.1 SDR family oxidoreductase [Terriglobus albidus]